MANYQPTPLSTSTSATPPNNVAAASDSYDIAIGGKYVLELRNTTASPNNVKLDDPNSVGAAGATTAQDPDVTITVPITTGVRFFLVDAWRFRDGATGRLTFTNSATGAGVTHNMLGPL